jgi:hypothetical protein
MEAIALILHICVISDSLRQFEECRVMVVPKKTVNECHKAADQYNFGKTANLPRFWRREATKLNAQVIVAPAHCEKPWHPTRNPRGLTIYTAPLSGDQSPDADLSTLPPPLTNNPDEDPEGYPAPIRVLDKPSA